MKRTIDLRTADWMIRQLKNYKRKRKEQLSVKNWNKLFGNRNSFVHKIQNDISINLFKDSILCRMMYEGFEENEVSLLNKILKPGDLVFDVGANIGMFALLASKIVGQNGKVIAFEPTPQTFRRFGENISLNNFTNIHAENIGLSDKNGHLQLFISEDGRDGWNTFAKNSRSGFQKTVDVPVNTLDNYCFQKNIPAADIRFLKIDVEGWELPVIKGGEKTLRDAENTILMVEFTEANAAGAGFNIADLYDLVVSYGYKWYLYDESNNRPVFDAKRKSYPYMNLFAVKNVDAINRTLADA